MVEAAARGVVDFRQAKFFDPAWRRRLKYLLGGLQDLNYREELKQKEAAERSLDRGYDPHTGELLDDEIPF